MLTHEQNKENIYQSLSPSNNLWFQAFFTIVWWEVYVLYVPNYGKYYVRIMNKLLLLSLTAVCVRNERKIVIEIKHKWNWHVKFKILFIFKTIRLYLDKIFHYTILFIIIILHNIIISLICAYISQLFTLNIIVLVWYTFFKI